MASDGAYTCSKAIDAIRSQDLAQVVAIFDQSPELLNTWVASASCNEARASLSDDYSQPLLYYAATMYHRRLFEERSSTDFGHRSEVVRHVPDASVTIVRAMVDRGAHFSRLPAGIPDGNNAQWEQECIFVMAGIQDSVAMVEQLLRAGAIPNVTALETAVRCDEQEIFAFVLDECVKNRNTTPHDFEQVLDTITCFGNWIMFNIMDDRGLLPSPNKLVQNTGVRVLDSLLVSASIYTEETFKRLEGRERIVAKLIDNGADIHARKTDGEFDRPLLYWVCRWASPELVQRFIHGGDLDVSMGRDPDSFPYLWRQESLGIPGSEKGGYVHFASLSCNPSAVESLLENHASINATTNGRTPIHWLSLKGHTSLFNLPNEADDLLSAQFKTAAKQTIEKLLEAGIVLDERDIYGRTAFHYACRLKMEELIQVLVDLGADGNIKDKNGHTPAHHLAQPFGEFNNDDFQGFVFSDKEWYTNKFAETIKSCFSPEQINAPDDQGMTPLMHASGSYHLVRLQWLLDIGADPNLQDKTGQTALHHAMIRPERYRVQEECYFRPSLWDLGDERIRQVVQILKAGGADALLKDHQGNIPEDVLGHEEVWIAPLRTKEAQLREEADKRQAEYVEKTRRFGTGRGRGRGKRC